MDITETRETNISPLLARIRLELENKFGEIYIAQNQIVITTSSNIYGFFETINSDLPYVAIQIPTGINPYTDSGKFTGEIGEIAKRYLIEKGVQTLSPTDTLSFHGFQDGILLLENPRLMKNYTIDTTGDITQEEIPVNGPSDTFIDEIPEPEE